MFEPKDNKLNECSLSPTGHLSQVLGTASNLITDSRAKTHGDYYENMSNIARMWTAYFQADPPITPSQVSDAFELAKIARRMTGSFNPDDYIDGIGYAAIAYGCRMLDTEKP